MPVKRALSDLHRPITREHKAKAITGDNGVVQAAALNVRDVERVPLDYHKLSTLQGGIQRGGSLKGGS